MKFPIPTTRKKRASFVAVAWVVLLPAVLQHAGIAYGQDAGDAPNGADRALHAQVSDAYRDGLVAVYDPQYPPSYFIDEDGEMAGYVIDFQNAIATKLGIPVKTKQAKFSAIISGIRGKRYDTSFFHGTPARRKKMDIVDLTQTGTAVMVKAGNPDGLDLHKLCGHKVGITKGGEQSIHLLPQLQSDCRERDRPKIDALVFSGPNEGSLALKTGRIQGWLGDAPYTGYIVRKSHGLFAKTPTANVSGLAGFAFRKGDPMADLFKKATAAMMADGTYQKILADWQISELALDKPLIDGK